MKHLALSSLALFASGAAAFTTTPRRGPTQSKTTSLNAENGVLKSMAAGFAGLTLASQIAFGVPMISRDDAPQQQHVVMEQLSSSPSSSIFLGARVETMDFSMPSYEDVTTTKKDSAPPAFTNPFPDLGSPASKTAEEKEAAKQSEKEAKEAAKQSAKEAKEAAAAKKAQEKEARLAAQLEKQREAVARSEKAKTDAEATVSAPVEVASPKETAPSPKETAPSAETAPTEEAATKFQFPEFKTPDIPKFDTSSFKAPELPKFESPSFDGFKTPEIPKLDLPSVDIPKIEAPAFQFPSLPFSSSPEAAKEPEESQDVRDERARAARAVFLTFDDDAKVAEAKARELRELANDKQRLAQEAKDVACETRWGGKFLCLRPFNSGY